MNYYPEYCDMQKHGNTKYKFHQLQVIGDIITEKPHNIYSLKSALRNYNIKREKAGEPKLCVSYQEYGGKRVDIVLTGFELADTLA